jgi:hypothetical protein
MLIFQFQKKTVGGETSSGKVADESSKENEEKKQMIIANLTNVNDYVRGTLSIKDPVEQRKYIDDLAKVLMPFMAKMDPNSEFYKFVQSILKQLEEGKLAISQAVRKITDRLEEIINQVKTAKSIEELEGITNRHFGMNLDTFLNAIENLVHSLQQQFGFFQTKEAQPHGGGPSPSVLAQLGLVSEQKRKQVRDTASKLIAKAQDAQASEKEGIEKTSTETKTIAINKSFKVPKKQQTESPSEKYSRAS